MAVEKHTSLRIQTPVGDCTIRRVGRIWHIRKQVKGVQLDESLHTRDPAVARERAELVLDRLHKQLALGNVAPLDTRLGTEANRIRKTYKVLDADYRRLYVRARGRAQKAGEAFTLSEVEMQALVVAANGACAVSGIPFSYQKEPGWFRAPYAPSLDRVSSQSGYTFENCRLVCVAVNWALSDWGVGVLLHVAKNIVARQVLHVD